MRSKIEPGLLNVFRYFTAIAVIYFAILWIVSMFSSAFGGSFKFQLSGSFVAYLGLFLYLNMPQLQKRFGRLYLPLAISVASIFPIVGNIGYLLDPQQATIYTIINRSWLWLPILFVPLVLISWQYDFKSMLIFTFCTNGLELLVMLVLLDQLTYENFTLVSVPLLRAFAFGTVGYIVNTMAETQRIQNDRLIQSNLRLNQYVNTLDQLATNRERTRLAGELHDTLAHTLSGLSINLEAIKTTVSEENNEAQGMLDHSLAITRSGLDETRRVIRALRAGPLEDLGLEKALDNLVQQASMRLSIPIQFSFPAALPVLPHEVEQSLYRITQESLENIVRHANASAAEVALNVTPNQLELVIHDNGAGFDPQGVNETERFGLQGLKERAASVGGKLTVTSQMGEGATIRFCWERFDD